MRQVSLYVWAGVLAAILSNAAIESAMGQQWTRFHGPNGTGVAKSISLPTQWSSSDYAWKTPLPGVGHSSPVVWGDRVFLLSADPKTATRYVLGISASTGKILWQRTYPSEQHHLHLRSSYASCTPAVDAERVYVAWSTPEQVTFTALDHDGKTQWTRELGRWVSQHGFGTSPMLYEDLVILSNSQQARQLKPGVEPGESQMMAFTAKTGADRWQTKRKSVNVCYSVPCIYTPEKGPPQLICTNTGDGMFSLDPLTGKQNWSVADAFSMRTVSSPLIVGDMIFGSTGSGGGGNYVVAVKVDEKPEIEYQIKTSAPYVPTSVARGNLAFLWSDKGIVSCVDVPTGKVHWRERVGGDYSGSPVLVGDQLYCISEDGEVVVLAAESEYKLLGRTPLGEASRSTPAVSGGRMFLRTYSTLFAIGAKTL